MKLLLNKKQLLRLFLALFLILQVSISYGGLWEWWNWLLSWTPWGAPTPPQAKFIIKPDTPKPPHKPSENEKVREQQKPKKKGSAEGREAKNKGTPSQYGKEKKTSAPATKQPGKQKSLRKPPKPLSPEEHTPGGEFSEQSAVPQPAEIVTQSSEHVDPQALLEQLRVNKLILNNILRQMGVLNNSIRGIRAEKIQYYERYGLAHWPGIPTDGYYEGLASNKTGVDAALTKRIEILEREITNLRINIDKLRKQKGVEHIIRVLEEEQQLRIGELTLLQKKYELLKGKRIFTAEIEDSEADLGQMGIPYPDSGTMQTHYEVKSEGDSFSEESSSEEDDSSIDTDGLGKAALGISGTGDSEPGGASSDAAAKNGKVGSDKLLAILEEVMRANGATVTAPPPAGNEFSVFNNPHAVLHGIRGRPTGAHSETAVSEPHIFLVHTMQPCNLAVAAELTTPNVGNTSPNDTAEKHHFPFVAEEGGMQR